MRAAIIGETKAAPFAHNERDLPAVEERVAHHERKGRRAVHLAAHQAVEQLLPAGKVGGIQVRREQVGLQAAGVGNVVPAVVVHHQELRVGNLHEVVGVHDVLPRFGVGGNVLGAPVLVVEAPDDDGRVGFAQSDEPQQLGAVVVAAAGRRAVRARHFHPQQQAQLIGQVVDAGVDARDVHPHQVAAQGFHGVHVELHFRVGRLARLVEDAVEVGRLVVEVHEPPPRFNLAQAEQRFDGRGVALAVDELRHQAVAVRGFGRPQLGAGHFQYHALLPLPRFQANGEVGRRQRGGAVRRSGVENLQANDVVAGVVNAQRQVEPHQLVLHDAHNPDAGAQPVALHHFQPHAAHGAGVGLVPNAAALVHVRFLLAARGFGVHRVGNAHGEAVHGAQVFRAQLVGERRVLAKMHPFALDGFEELAVEPDPRFVPAGPERELHHGARLGLGNFRQGKLPLVPHHYLVVPGGGILMATSLRQMLFHRAGPLGPVLVLVARCPVLLQAHIVVVVGKGPLPVEQHVAVDAEHGPGQWVGYFVGKRFFDVAKRKRVVRMIQVFHSERWRGEA